MSLSNKEKKEGKPRTHPSFTPMVIIIDPPSDSLCLGFILESQAYSTINRKFDIHFRWNIHYTNSPIIQEAYSLSFSLFFFKVINYTLGSTRREEYQISENGNKSAKIRTHYLKQTAIHSGDSLFPGASFTSRL